MIGILLLIGPLFAIWNYFSRLAHDHDRSRVGFAFLGMGTYIFSIFLSAFMLGVIIALTGALQVASSLLTDLICIAFAGLCTGLLYYLLKRSWEKKRSLENDSQLLDS